LASFLAIAAAAAAAGVAGGLMLAAWQRGLGVFVVGVIAKVKVLEVAWDVVIVGVATGFLVAADADHHVVVGILVAVVRLRHHVLVGRLGFADELEELLAEELDFRGVDVGDVEEFALVWSDKFWLVPLTI
jgi:hypothetical protein